MIDKSQQFTDAPPPYQRALQTPAAPPHAKPRPSPGSVPVSPQPPPLGPRSSSAPSAGRRLNKQRTKNNTRWLPTAIFGLSKTAKQVKATSQSILRDLLSQPHPSEQDCLAVLASCAEACSAQELDFASLLQEPFVEGHLPIYWAILKRPASPVKTDHTAPPGDPDALVLAIMDASLPLNSQSIADARLGCMTVSDNALFVRLGQRYDVFAQRLGTDRMLLGGADVVDTVSVEEQRNGGGAFRVDFSLAQFQLRMRVSKIAKVEFIARGRLWYLAFAVAGAAGTPNTHPTRSGEWIATLGMGEHSQATWVDARLVVFDRSLPPSPSAPEMTPTAQRMTVRGQAQPPRHPSSAGKERPTISLQLKTGSQQIAPNGPIREIVVPLSKSSYSSNLQNDASSYVDLDGTLCAQLEVKLNKTSNPDANCVIC
ncbi:hypothetical protein BC834DRAFT_968113 [Gloeopeniophorella convolvens]|nr:hypothetical protein BC834DRAFT_968113 [Gloeopeniophorella convolvens]